MIKSRRNVSIVTIQRMTKTDGVKAFATIASNIRCIVIPLSKYNQLDSDSVYKTKNGEGTLYHLYFDSAVDIAEGDLVTDASSNKFKVLNDVEANLSSDLIVAPAVRTT